MADNKCDDHWFNSKEDLDKHGDCPYNHDENGKPVKTDPYLVKLKNKIIEKVSLKDKSDVNWIEKRLKEVLPKEEDLKDISKVMLAHRISCLEEELKEIIEERDEIAEENRRLTEENNNLETLLKNKNELSDQTDPKN